jgi:hypothetical protein
LKKIVPIALLVLLLYNTFGLSFAILFFDDNYQLACSGYESQDTKLMKMYLPSLPYSGDLEVSPQLKGLIKQDGNFYNPTSIQHQNDTLYVTLKENQAARDHFFELANAMQIVTDPDMEAPQNPFGKMVKLLGSMLKIYVPNHQGIQVYANYLPAAARQSFQSVYGIAYYSYVNALSTPPPELS